MREFSIEKREIICKNCPIFSKGKCNPKLWLNPDTDQVSTYPKAGYIRGCGCFILQKLKNPVNHCVAGKW